LIRFKSLLGATVCPHLLTHTTFCARDEDTPCESCDFTRSNCLSNLHEIGK